ncbi:MAG: hypothetical protein K9L17_03960 [Clostridiales bacterium]|nr:hypothetical protein [Clostridiales bacterium]MCF8021834.1 hypothetical protein [Clostridiales bacterium]
MNRWAALILLPWEKFFSFIKRTHPVHSDACGIILVGYHKYRGKPFTLPDGTEIMPGSKVGEIHLANLKLKHISEHKKSTEWSMLHVLKNELYLLAKEIEENTELTPVTGIYSITVASAGAKRLGFHVRKLPRNPVNSFIASWEYLLARTYALPFARTRIHRELTEVWISRKQLQNML